MKPAQLLLSYQRLVERERELRDDIERRESRLASDPEVVRNEELLARFERIQRRFWARQSRSFRN